MQPLIKENPSPAELAKLVPRSTNPVAGAGSAVGVPGAATTGATVTPLVKHVLSRELQLYFTRLTDALGRAGLEQRDAALGSVRSDPGLHQLVPYLVSWGGEQVSLVDWVLGGDGELTRQNRSQVNWTTSARSSARWTSFTRCSRTRRCSSSLMWVALPPVLVPSDH